MLHSKQSSMKGTRALSSPSKSCSAPSLHAGQTIWHKHQYVPLSPANWMHRHLCPATNSLPTNNQHLSVGRHHQHVVPPSRAVLDFATGHPIATSSVEERPHLASFGELGYPQTFGQHFRLASSAPLGCGQYGVVYRAQHLGSMRMVAVKVMNKDREDRSRSEHLECIQNEVALWRACQPCKHVVRIEGVYEDERCVYLVQQLCSGGDLRAVLQGGQLSEQEAARVMRSVLEVIHTCHTQGYVYGDCKPANFLLLHPHRATGCKQYPQHPAGSVPDSSREQGPGTSSSSRHSDTIREHLLASFQLPAAAGAASVSGTAAGVAVVAAGGVAAAGAVVAAAAQVVATGAGPPALLNILTPLTSGLPTAAATTGVQSKATGNLDSSCPPVTGSSAAGNMRMETAETDNTASTTSSWLSVLTEAQPVGPHLLDQWMYAEAAARQGQLAAAGLAEEGVWLDRCGPQCHEEMVVLATDFGCCQPLHASHRKGVITTKRLGSPVYMAPEMWQSGAHVGPAVDVWAAGVMLYQLISGRYPFWPMSPERIDEGGMQLYQVVCGIQSNPIHFSGEPWQGVSRQCKNLIQAMLERQPHARISAHAALRHPWLSQQLGYTPLPAAHQDPQNNCLDGGMEDHSHNPTTD